ncbi:NAD(P)H-binding protein [Flavobacterium sp. 14A]|uniref:NAD(P)H-binding protein n=1 Tax=Flavobacterium sp. 14A TaxID=2735896 RepID=UPI001570AB5C|nr:NAD(P)H-binding protein [Flavobacterium sp. 14A]NRT13016.1 nucleoside-diphosphate-sugar epimerase [Flavobacterium sp. 14A]
MRQISVLGCGWLGLPLAKALLQQEFTVKGSTTTSEKLPSLNQAGIKAYLIELESDKAPLNIGDFLEGSETLIIAIPPRLRGKNKDYSDANANSFVKKITMLLPTIEKAAISHLLFVSSTAIYGDINTDIYESTPPQPQTESGKQLLEIEQILQQQTAFKTTIVRFGGLIGPNRNPARFMAGKEGISNPDAAVNLIEQEDCINIILRIIATNTWGEDFNAAAPYHPGREKYYTAKAIEQGLVPPVFDHSKPSEGKTINSDKLIKMLNYTFINTTL